MRQYSDELKAQVIAEAAIGTPVRRIADKLGVPEATCRLWVKLAHAQPVVAQEKQNDLGILVYELCTELARGATAIGIKLQDPGWLEKQSADHLAISLGVAVDKLAGLLAAMERGRRAEAERRAAEQALISG